MGEQVETWAEQVRRVAEKLHDERPCGESLDDCCISDFYFKLAAVKINLGQES